MSLRKSAVAGILILYGAIAAVAFLWAWFDGRISLFIFPGAPVSSLSALRLTDWLMMGAIGFFGGLTASAALLLAVRSLRWFRLLDDFFMTLVGGFSIAELVIMILWGSLAEEVLFRGAMQPSVGILAQAAVFAVLHTGPRRLFIFLLPWTFMAFGSALFLGWLFQFTGTLIAPIAAHMTINAFSILRIRLRIRRDGLKTLDDVITSWQNKE